MPIPHISAAELNQEVVPKTGRQVLNRQLKRKILKLKEKPQKYNQENEDRNQKGEKREMFRIFGIGTSHGESGKGRGPMGPADGFLTVPPYPISEQLAGRQVPQAVGRLSPLERASTRELT